jgi:hypothetical protein
MASPFLNSQSGLAFGASNKDANKYVYYVALDMYTMRRIYDYYMRGDSLISRANAIVSDQAFGQGYYLEWAASQKIMPEDAYDYTSDVQSLLERAAQWRAMFGFVAFVRPETSAREEIARIENNYHLTPEEIAEQHIRRCTLELHEQLGIVVDGDGADDTEAKDLRRRQDAESRRVNPQVPRNSDGTGRGGGGTMKRSLPPVNTPEELNSQRKAMSTMTIKETSAHNADSRTVADSEISFVLKKHQAAKQKIERMAESTTSLMDMLITLGEVKIVGLDSGDFYLQVDELTGNNKIVWVPRWRAKATMIAAGGPSTHVRFVDYDPNVFVYIWQGREPTIEGIIQTQFYELMRKQQVLREAEDNLMFADFHASHPTPVVQQSRAPTKTDAMELPEEDIYGTGVMSADMYGIANRTGGGDGIGNVSGGVLDTAAMAPNELTSYKRDVRESMLLEMTVQAGQNEQLQKRVKLLAEGHARNTRATRNGLSVSDVKASMFEMNGLLHLPGGLQFGGIITPTTVASVSEAYAIYQQELSVELGVPLSYLRGDQVGKKSSASGGGDSNSAVSDGSKKTSGGGGGASVAESLMRTTIMRYRDDSSSFFNFVYDSLFHDRDNSRLRKELTEIRSSLESTNEVRDALIRRVQRSYKLIRDVARLDDTLTSTLSESGRLTALEQDIKRIISMKSRLKLKFLKTPFVDNDTVMSMYAAGALSHEEMVNITRQNVGLTKLEKSEIGRMLDESMDVMQRKATAATPVAPDTATTEIVESEVKGGKSAVASPATATKPAGKPAPPEQKTEKKTTIVEAIDRKKKKEDDDDGSADEKEKKKPPKASDKKQQKEKK